MVTATSLHQAGGYRTCWWSGPRPCPPLPTLRTDHLRPAGRRGRGRRPSAPDNDVSGCTTRSSAPTAPGPATSGRPPAASAEPTRPKTVNERLHYMKMKGRDVYTVRRHQDAAGASPRPSSEPASPSSSSRVVPHQSNRGSSSRSPPKSSAAREQGGPVNIDRYGNTRRGVDSARVGRGLENGPRTPGTGAAGRLRWRGSPGEPPCFGFNRGSCARCRQPQYSLPAKVPRLPAWAATIAEAGPAARESIAAPMKCRLRPGRPVLARVPADKARADRHPAARDLHHRRGHLGSHRRHGRPRRAPRRHGGPEPRRVHTLSMPPAASTFEDALRWSTRRGELMQAASQSPPSGMVSLMGWSPPRWTSSARKRPPTASSSRPITTARGQIGFPVKRPPARPSSPSPPSRRRASQPAESGGRSIRRS